MAHQRKMQPVALEVERVKLVQRNLTVGQHVGSLINCCRVDHNLSIFVHSVASYRHLSVILLFSNAAESATFGEQVSTAVVC